MRCHRRKEEGDARWDWMDGWRDGGTSSSARRARRLSVGKRGTRSNGDREPITTLLWSTIIFESSPLSNFHPCLPAYQESTILIPRDSEPFNRAKCWRLQVREMSIDRKAKSGLRALSLLSCELLRLDVSTVSTTLPLRCILRAHSLYKLRIYQQRMRLGRCRLA